MLKYLDHKIFSYNKYYEKKKSKFKNGFKIQET